MKSVLRLGIIFGLLWAILLVSSSTAQQQRNEEKKETQKDSHKDDEAKDNYAKEEPKIPQRDVAGSRSMSISNDLFSQNNISPDLLDPAFERYVDLHLLQAAWERLDPALMTDVALQLAEGERILLRSHKSFKADDILNLAAKMAVEKKDKATLERLAKAATQLGKDSLKSQVTTADKLAGQSRAIDPAMMVPVEDLTPEEFGAYQDLVRQVRGAHITLDQQRLKWLLERIQNDDTLKPERRECLKKMISESRDTMPKDTGPDPTVAALEKLSGGSRSWVSDRTGIHNPPGIPAIDLFHGAKPIFQTRPQSTSGFGYEGPDREFRSTVFINNPAGNWGGPVNFGISVNGGPWANYALGDGQGSSYSRTAINTPAQIRISFSTAAGGQKIYNLQNGMTYDFNQYGGSGRLDLGPH